MPYAASPRGPFDVPERGPFRVLRVSWSADPVELARCLEPLLAGADERAERARSAGVVEGLVRAGEQVLAQIEELESAKARLEGDLLAAYGALASIEEQQIKALPRGGSAVRMAGPVSAERVVAEEIALATGVGAGEVARRLAVATAPRRHRVMLAALREGVTSLSRVLQVASDTAVLCDADVATVQEAVLAPSRDGGVVGQRTFTARLRRAVAAVEAAEAQERRARARARRGVFGRMTADGMGYLSLTADGPTIAAVLDRLDATARSLRGGGDPRSLDQLRCDLATHALLGGPVIGPASGGASGGSAAGGAGDACDRPWFTAQAAARVWLVLPFEVATGESDAACELPGHGWVTAAHARAVMTRPGSVWQTLPVDISTGHAIGRPTKSYRPSRAMVEHVQAVDGTCRGPDCQVLAARCDLDHETPWPAGDTTVDNLFTKHRLHHNVKTDDIWTSRPTGNGPGPTGRALEWTTLTGRTYTTHPKNWREGLDPPGPGPDSDPPPF
jgi:hypothetical protein